MVPVVPASHVTTGCSTDVGAAGAAQLGSWLLGTCWGGCTTDGTAATTTRKHHCGSRVCELIAPSKPQIGMCCNVSYDALEGSMVMMLQSQAPVVAAHVVTAMVVTDGD